MAWRVSWAPLWTAMSDAKPIPAISVSPRKRARDPAISLWEMDRVAVLVNAFMVPTPSVWTFMRRKTEPDGMSGGRARWCLRHRVLTGRSPGSWCLCHWAAPSRLLKETVALWAQFTTYSCGGSHGFGPFWVRLTMFPFDSLPFVGSETSTHLFAHECRFGSMAGTGRTGGFGLAPKGLDF